MGKHYRNPPLIEALCEIHFEQTSPWDFAIPGMVYDKVRGTFPNRNQAIQITLGISASPEITGHQLGAMPLTQFLSEDGKSLVQVGPHLLAVNHLKPYTSWLQFLPLIELAYNAYRDVASPQGIHRIGLRYINRIEIESQSMNLGDYFEFRPFVGPKIPQTHGAFIVGIQIPYENTRDILNLQLSSLTGVSPVHTLTIMLDLNYSLVQPGAVALDDVSTWVEIAHSHIEEIFEACITDKLRQHFEEVIE